MVKPCFKRKSTVFNVSKYSYFEDLLKFYDTTFPYQGKGEVLNSSESPLS